jgi:hypothetical protein
LPKKYSPYRFNQTVGWPPGEEPQKDTTLLPT